MGRESIGSIRRVASIVAGAAGSQRAVKWRSSPTVISSTPMSGGYVASSGPDTPDLPQTASSDIPTMPTISTPVPHTEAGPPREPLHAGRGRPADSPDPGPDRRRRPDPRSPWAADVDGHLPARVQPRPHPRG